MNFQATPDASTNLVRAAYHNLWGPLAGRFPREAIPQLVYSPDILEDLRTMENWCMT